MTQPVINIADIQLHQRPEEFAATGPAAERYDARMGLVGEAIGTRKLGCNITAVPPGMRAFPRHNHHVNEELFHVLRGSGEVRIGDKVFAIREGDFIACPPGGPETAHQIANTGNEELHFLAISTREPEIVEYPDSGKFGVLAEIMHPGTEQPRVFRFIGREEQVVDYWDGE